MALCPTCSTTLTALPNTGVGTFLVCTGCKQHFYATGGTMIRSPYTAGGVVTAIVTSSPTITVSHGLLIIPGDGELMLTPKVLGQSGATYRISATSSLNFVITTDVLGANTSGMSFFWQYNKA